VAGQKDDLLNPDEIEALLKPAAGAQPPRGGTPGSAAAKPAADKELLDPADIEALLKQRDVGRSSTPAKSAAQLQPGRPPLPQSPAARADDLVGRAEADLASALAPDLESFRRSPPDLGQAEPFQFQPFDSAARQKGDGVGLDALGDVELDLRIELGRTELLIDEVLQLKEGSVVPLDKLAGDPVDILVNGRLVARGEVLVLNDNFCVRVAEILTPDF
jgi:flagellar motor switch protein FliN/FliY